MTDYFENEALDPSRAVRTLHDIGLTRFHLRVKLGGNPAFRIGEHCIIMKYRSGNARRAPMRGAFAFEFTDRISLSYSLRCAQALLCSPSKVAILPRVNFPVALEMSTAYFFPAGATLDSSIASRSRKRETQRLCSRRLRAYETIGRKVEAILGRRNVHKLSSFIE